MILLRVKGLPPLALEAQYVDEQGWSCYHLNDDKVDWAESCNNARALLFPDVPLPAVDPVFDEIMRARWQRSLH